MVIFLSSLGHFWRISGMAF